MTMQQSDLMLQWNHHQQVLGDIADTLQHKDPDVTLVYSDGGEGAQFSGSRILLSASSPFLYALLKDQPQISTTIVVTGSGGKNPANFSSIMNFVHTGTMIVSNDDLKEVIEIASQLQLNCFSDLDKNQPIKHMNMKKDNWNAAFVGAAVPQYSAYPPQVRGALEDHVVGDLIDALDEDCSDGGMLGGNDDGYGDMFGMGGPPTEYPIQLTQEITPIIIEAVEEDSNIEFKSISGPLNMKVMDEETYQNLKQEMCDKNLKQETVDQTVRWRCDLCGKTWLDNTRDARRHAKRHMESHLLVKFQCVNCDKFLKTKESFYYHKSKYCKHVHQQSEYSDYLIFSVDGLVDHGDNDSKPKKEGDNNYGVEAEHTTSLKLTPKATRDVRRSTRSHGGSDQ